MLYTGVLNYLKQIHIWGSLFKIVLKMSIKMQPPPFARSNDRNCLNCEFCCLCISQWIFAVLITLGRLLGTVAYTFVAC